MVVPKLRFKGFTGEWDKIKLSQIADIIKDKNDGAEHPVMMLSAVKGFINQQEKYSKDNAGSSLKKYTLLRRGDLAYNRGNSKLKKYGCIFELENSSALVPYVYHCFRMKNGNSTFYGNYLNSGKIDKELRGIISSSARMDGLLNVSEKDFVNILVSKPILSEQQKIADFLTTFDKRITAQQNIIADLEETKKGLLQKIFSQEIRFKDDNGQDYPEWEEKRLGDISYVMRGLTYKPTDVRDDGIRVFRSSNISEDTFIYGEDDVFVDVNAVNIPFVQNGDILITAANGSSRLVGKHSVIHGVLNDTAVHGGFMLLIRSKDSAFINSSMYSSWYKKFVYKFVAGGNGAIGNLKKSDLENVHLFVPCEKEKNKIDDFLSIFDKKITAEKQILSDLLEIKKGLLQQMFV